MSVKQVIVMRTKYPDGKGGTLGLRAGKMCAQASHASAMWLIKIANKHRDGLVAIFSEDEIEWMNGDFAKVVLQVGNEEELKSVELAAKAANLTVETITDLGKTEFNDVPTVTCLAIGPHKSELIDPITKHLKLY